MLLSFPKCRQKHRQKFRQMQRPMYPPGSKWARYITTLIIICLPVDLIAAEWYTQSDMSLKSVYDDNKRLTALPHDRVVGSLLNINGKLGIQTEKTELDLIPSARFSRYSGDDDLDSNDYFLDLKSLLATEWLIWGLNGKYMRDTSLTSELEETGLVQTRKKREKVDINPSLLYEISEWTKLKVAIDLTQVEYKNAVLTGLIDYDFKTLNMTIIRETGDASELNVSVNASRFEASDINNESDHIGLTTTYKQSLTTSMDSEILIGIRKSDFNSNQNSDEKGILFKLGINKEYERTNWNTELSRTINPGGSGSVIQKDRFSVNATRFMTDKLRALLNLSLLKNKELENSATTNIDRKYKQISAQLHWRFADDWSIRGGYRYRRNQIDNTLITVDSNAIELGFIYRPR